MSDDQEGFPVDPPEGKRPGLVKGSPAAIAAGKRLTEARRAKREERERGGGAGGGSKAPKATRSSSSASPPSHSELAEIETSIVEGLTKLGAAATPIAPVPGVYVIQTAEETGKVLTRLAAKNPAILRALSSSSNVMDYVAVGVWLVGLGVAIQVQTGRIPADSRAAGTFGLTEIAVEFYGDRLYAQPEPEPEPVEGSGAFDPFQVPVPPDVADAEARAVV